MNVYENRPLDKTLAENSYPGRGILIGLTPDGANAVVAYFIMGRSENSRNRVFVQDIDDITIYPFDESKVEDPSLIIYSPVRALGNHLIVTNGDQTDTIYDALQNGGTFADALKTRCFEPDAPNYTPRISGMLTFEGDDFTYQMSILKSADPMGTACNRYTFDYTPVRGVAHFLHTYNGDGNPIPTFTGEPERLAIGNGIDEVADTIWQSLNEDNKVSLFVRFIELATGETETRLFNKNY